MTTKKSLQLKSLRSIFVCLMVTTFLINVSFAQQQTVGLFQNKPGSFDGYTLFSCIYCAGINLIDNCGKKVHSWGDDIRLANSAYLQEDGSLILNYNTSNADPTIRAGGGGEGIMKLDWESNVLWDFKYNGPEYRVHHDFAVMPNGNILSLAFEDRDYDACIQAGRDPAKLSMSRIWSEKVVEIEPTGPTTGNIVWEWKLWDHLIQDFDSTRDNFGMVEAHPELLDLNFINT